MNTLDELVAYCKDINPPGAFLLTGEWGCGKSHLMRNDFETKAKENQWVKVSISLFGISTAEELKREIKKQWFFACGDKIISKKTGTIKKWLDYLKAVKTPVKMLLEKIKDHLPAKWGKMLNGALSINLFDLIQMENYLDPDKTIKVILVFDDLERTSIPTKDFLGIVNDLCENQHFNTIVVANEDKLNKNVSESLSYDEIKEKIILRTVEHIPDYKSVIANVIKEYENGGVLYKGFLNGNKEKLTELFQGDLVYVSPRKAYPSYEAKREEEEHIRNVEGYRQHNIRSLKCAIHDFERIYNVLVENKINTLDKWFFSFTAYVLAYKSGYLTNSFSEFDIEIMYPGYYDSRYIVGAEKSWIQKGEWDKETLSRQIQWVMQKDAALSPLELVKTYSLFELEEDDIDIGYPQVLDLAYAGELNLIEYVNLINNAYWAREFKVDLPKAPDWEKIRLGIQEAIRKVLDEDGEPQRIAKIITPENKQYYKDEEWKAYKLIEDFRTGDLQMFRKNRNLFIRVMKTEPENAFESISNKRFNVFDEEMQVATFDAYKKCSNFDKRGFSRRFKNIWSSCLETGDIDKESLFPQIRVLLSKLDELNREYETENKPIASRHTTDFIEILHLLLGDEVQS